MEETFDFLKKLSAYFVATINGDKPSLRPFGATFKYDNKIYFITSKHKNVSKQIAENDNVCIVGIDESEDWIRINCKLIDDSNNIEAKKVAIDSFDWMIPFGYTLDNPDFQLLYLSDANAFIYDEEGVEKQHFNF
jgi:uncharacterized pyridoxamine 5'-phosphate oxidase family protein